MLEGGESGLHLDHRVGERIQLRRHAFHPAHESTDTHQEQAHQPARSRHERGMAAYASPRLSSVHRLLAPSTGFPHASFGRSETFLRPATAPPFSFGCGCFRLGSARLFPPAGAVLGRAGAVSGFARLGLGWALAEDGRAAGVVCAAISASVEAI